MKISVLREIAEQDIENAYVWYMQNAGAEIAVVFIGAIDTALLHIEAYPGSGSPRYAEILEMTGLRSCQTEQFPYTLFYVERDDCLDVIRLLHQHSDIAAHLQEQSD